MIKRIKHGGIHWCRQFYVSGGIRKPWNLDIWNLSGIRKYILELIPSLVKSYPKRAERRRARGSAQLQLPFRSPRMCVREDRARHRLSSPLSSSLQSSRLARWFATFSSLLSSFDARAPAYGPPPPSPRVRYWWRAPTLINAKLRHRTFPRFKAPCRGAASPSPPPPPPAIFPGDTVFRNVHDRSPPWLQFDCHVQIARVKCNFLSFVTSHLATSYATSETVRRANYWVALLEPVETINDYLNVVTM